MKQTSGVGTYYVSSIPNLTPQGGHGMGFGAGGPQHDPGQHRGKVLWKEKVASCQWLEKMKLKTSYQRHLCF